MMPETDTVSVFTIIYIHVAQSSIWHEANTIISIIGGLFYGYTHVPDIALGFEALCTACTIGITVCTGCAVAYRNTKKPLPDCSKRGEISYWWRRRDLNS